MSAHHCAYSTFIYEGFIDAGAGDVERPFFLAFISPSSFRALI